MEHKRIILSLGNPSSGVLAYFQNNIIPFSGLLCIAEQNQGQSDTGNHESLGVDYLKLLVNGLHPIYSLYPVRPSNKSVKKERLQAALSHGSLAQK